MLRRLVLFCLILVLPAILAGCSRQSVTDFTPYPGEAAGASATADLADHDHDHEEDHDHE